MIELLDKKSLCYKAMKKKSLLDATLAEMQSFVKSLNIPQFELHAELISLQRIDFAEQKSDEDLKKQERLDELTINILSPFAEAELSIPVIWI